MNKAKCELKPVRNLTFLGARWGRTEIKRLANTTRSVVNVIKAIPRLKTLKQQQQASGFLQYYLSFAGNCARAIQLAFEDPTQAGKLIKLAKKAFLKFKPSKTAKSALIYSDATPGQLGAVVQGIGYTKVFQKSHINVDELKAAIYALKLAIRQLKPGGSIVHYVDNTVALAALRKNRLKLIKNMDTVVAYILFINYINSNYYIKYHYVASLDNPADSWSRVNPEAPLVFTKSYLWPTRKHNQMGINVPDSTS